MNSYGYIYKTTNLLNGKVYIGQKKSPKFVKTYFGSGKIIKQALNLHGKKNFDVELLGKAFDKKELDNLEIHYIEIMRKNFPLGMVYNIANGGGTVTGFRHSKEHRNSMKGENNPAKNPSVRKKISESHIGDKNHMKKMNHRIRMTGKGNPMYGRKRLDFSLTRTLLNYTNNPVWKPENRMRISTYTRNHPESGLKGLHNRWHTSRGIINNNCKFCMNRNSMEESLCQS